ncbi:MAG: hypothetical protein RL172_2850, partial [Bacteroidota bacterium]
MQPAFYYPFTDFLLYKTAAFIGRPLVS